MSELIQRAAAVGRPAAAGLQPSQDVLNQSWNGKVTSFEDVVPAAPPGEEVLSSGVLLERPVRRRKGTNDYFRRGLAWRIEPRAVVVAALEQPLHSRPDGRFSTAGPWSAARTTRHAANGPVRQRTGEVAEDPRADAATSGSAPATPAGPMADLDFLPLVVRTGFMGALTGQTQEGAEAMRFTRSDGSHYYRVSAVRVGTSEVVCLTATRQGDAPVWQVEQRTFTFSPTSTTPGLESGQHGPRAGELSP